MGYWIHHKLAIDAPYLAGNPLDLLPHTAPSHLLGELSSLFPPALGLPHIGLTDSLLQGPLWFQRHGSEKSPGRNVT